MYGAEAEAAITEINRRSILTISNSMDLPSYEKNLELAERSPFVVPTFGIHPWNAPLWVRRLGELDTAIDRTPMLGETGLDHRFIEDEALYLPQQEVFEFLLAAAARTGKAVCVHTSGAERTVLHLLEKHGVTRVIVHWYAGPMNIMQDLVDRGALFTIGVAVTTSEHVRRIAAELPDHLLLTETDNPGALEWLSGEPGMPSALDDVVAELAHIRGTTPSGIERTVATNFARLVRDDEGFSAVEADYFREGNHDV